MEKEKLKCDGEIWGNSLAVNQHKDAPSRLEKKKSETKSTSPVPWLENGYL